MQPAAGQGLAEFGARRIVTEQAIDLARRGKSFEAIRLFDRMLALLRRRPGSWAQAFRHRLPDVFGDERLGLARIDHHAAGGLFLGDIEEGFADALMLAEILAFEAVRSPCAAAPRAPAPPPPECRARW